MKAQVKQIDFIGQNSYAGFDAHYKSWKVTVMTEDTVYKTFTKSPNPETLYNYLKNNFSGGTYHSAYEAGFYGYWIHNKLEGAEVVLKLSCGSKIVSGIIFFI